MALKASSEFQSIVLSTLVKDADLLSRVVNHVDINYFDKPSYRYIFNNLCMYYNNYGRIPNMESLIVLLKDNYNTSNSESLVDILQEYENLYNTPRYEPEFVVDKLQIFIKRAKVEKILSEVMPEVQKGKEVLIENLGVQLSDALDFNINRNNSFKLSDIDKLHDMRLKAVGDDGNSLIIKSFIPKINDSLQFKGYKPGDIVMIVSPPGCGKTMFCINECTSAALQGFNVLHMFIGDMTEYDGFIRYVSNISNILQDDLVSMPLHDQYNVVKRSNYTGVLDRISVASYSASELTVNELIQEVDRLQLDNKVHYDLISIDYADNLIPESDMLYKSGGDIYNKLSELGRRNRSTLLVASQPKTTYWDTEIIPKEGAAESAKKQHVVDLMITMNRYNKIAKFGTIFLPKVRRGTEGALIRWRSEFEKAKLSIIDNLEYNTMKAELSQE